ncbi:MAG: VapC toxin family PIN domain ribonuclease, partial [Actinomycetota bacterium]|nr:VapC toxin family PIN domain ribonuclease [Actinomycetota bacterium]
MALIIDAGGLYAQADRADPAHEAVIEVLKEERGPLVTSGIAAAEADYLILSRLGIDTELAFLDDLAEG